MALMQQPGQVNVQPTTMTLSSFAAKWGSKGEIYRFLTVEACVYLCPYENITCWHMRDICSGEKQRKSANSLLFLTPLL